MFEMRNPMLASQHISNVSATFTECQVMLRNVRVCAAFTTTPSENPKTLVKMVSLMVKEGHGVIQEG